MATRDDAVIKGNQDGDSEGDSVRRFVRIGSDEVVITGFHVLRETK